VTAEDSGAGHLYSNGQIGMNAGNKKQAGPDAKLRALAARISDGMSQMEQVLAFNTLVDRLMNTQRFCEYHKRIAAIDPACNICFPSPPKP